MILAEDDDPYDIAIQFSHTMNSRITKSAISVRSSDSSTVIDSLWWDAGDMAYITLCTRYGTNECVRGDSLYKEHVTYTVTIASAQSIAGVHFAYPENISFTRNLDILPIHRRYYEKITQASLVMMIACCSLESAVILKIILIMKVFLLRSGLHQIIL